MGIQDRDYYHEKHRHHAGVSDRRDYSERLREMEAKGQRIVLEEEPQIPPAPNPWGVGQLLVIAVMAVLGYLVFKVLKVFF